MTKPGQVVNRWQTVIFASSSQYYLVFINMYQSLKDLEQALINIYQTLEVLSAALLSNWLVSLN